MLLAQMQTWETQVYECTTYPAGCLVGMSAYLGWCCAQTLSQLIPNLKEKEREISLNSTASMFAFIEATSEKHFTNTWHDDKGSLRFYCH